MDDLFPIFSVQEEGQVEEDAGISAGREEEQVEEDAGNLLFIGSGTLILNQQINVASLMQSEQIIAQMRLSSSEMYFFGLLYKAFPEYVADEDIHLSSASLRKHILPSLRRKMLSFAPHIYFLRIKEVGYVLLVSTPS